MRVHHHPGCAGGLIVVTADGAIRVEGLTELRRAIRAAEDDVGRDELKATHLDAARIVADESERLVPRRSGLLASSIRAAGQQAKAVVRAGYKRIPYVGPIHFGWPGHNIAPQPFIYDALDRRADEVVEAYQRRVDKLASDLVRRANA